MLFLRTALARSYSRVWGMTREPSWIFFEVVVPLINTSAFVFLYKALNAPPAFVGFVVLGGAMAAYWMNVLWGMATQLYWDKQDGNLELYVIAPTSMMAVLVGMGVGGMFAATLRAATIAVIGTLIFGVTVNSSQWAFSLLVFCVTMVALYSLGMALSSLFLMWGREGWQVALSLTEPVQFLSGMNFPLSSLFTTIPGVLTIFSAIIPVSFGLDALRQLLFPGQITGVLPPGIELAILGGMGVVFLVAAYLLLRHMEWLARVEARLSLRWQ